MSLLAGNKMLASLWADIERMENEATYAAVQKNPKAYRDCQLMERGKGLRYFWYENKTARKGQTTRFCYTKHRNAAGYYLSFIEVWNEENGARFAFLGHDTKREAMNHCEARLKDSRKPKIEQKFTIPTIAKKVGKRK